MYLSLAAVCVAVLISLLGGFFTVRRITHSIRSASGELEEASEMGNRLSLTVSASASSLADGCSEQASSIEEIHATVEEITSMAASEGESVDRVLKLAGESDASVSESSASTKKMRGAMQRIQESSSQIGSFKSDMHQMRDLSERQRTAIAQVASSIGEIDRVTQRNAASAQESAEASREMEEQSRLVLQQISQLESVLIGVQGLHSSGPARADSVRQEPVQGRR